MNDREPSEGPGAGALLAATLRRLAPTADGAVLTATAELLCREREQGHVCVALRDLAGQPGADGTPLPQLAAWRAALVASGLCSDGRDPHQPTPFVLDGDDRLYLWRHHRAEQRLLAALRKRLAAPAALSAADLRAALDEQDLLPAAGGGGAAPDWQLAAIAAAAHRPFLLLTGGPGTGKTTTVAHLLAVLLHQRPTLRIALAAPTGKAAARLGEALRERAANLPHLGPALAALQPMTLHRLLGYLPLDDAFRAGPTALLPFDLVVVDEASMVDPAVLAVLVDALRADARLVLVGDRDQLAAVAAGQVLGDLCRAARPDRGVGPALADYVAAATGMRLPVQRDGAPIADAVIALRTSHRFGEMPGIGGFATALAERDPQRALQVLDAGHDDLARVPAERALAPFAAALQRAVDASDVTAALRALGSVRVLCATRHGPHGTAAWNRRVEALLGEHGVPVDRPWYLGRPILITANDPQNRVWNGDLGVVWPDEQGRPAVWFADAAGPRAIAPLRLPAHETAWAMTVHKAQGSEYDDVLLVMPDKPGPLWQASLVYTGITRARRRARLVADPALLAACLGHWPERSSGLAAGLLADRG